MYKRYSLSDIQKEVINLLQNNNPMSSSEIAVKIGVNRITISKYLEILFIQRIICKKKIGSVNFWFLEQGISNLDSKEENLTEIQQKLINSLLDGQEKITYNTILSLINKNIDLKKMVIDLYFPVLNTIIELYNRGKIGKTEKIHLLSKLSDSIRILKNMDAFNKKISSSSILIIVSGDDESIPICLLIEIWVKEKLMNATFIGNVQTYIDPFFDIDFQRYISKIIHRIKEKVIICVVSYNERSVKFLNSSLKENEFTNNVKVFLFSNKDIQQKMETTDAIVYTNIEDLIEKIEGAIKN